MSEETGTYAIEETLLKTTVFQIGNRTFVQKVLTGKHYFTHQEKVQKFGQYQGDNWLLSEAYDVPFIETGKIPGRTRSKLLAIATTFDRQITLLDGSEDFSDCYEFEILGHTIACTDVDGSIEAQLRSKISKNAIEALKWYAAIAYQIDGNKITSESILELPFTVVAAICAHIIAPLTFTLPT